MKKAKTDSMRPEDPYLAIAETAAMSITMYP